MDSISGADVSARAGEELAAVTNGIVRLFTDWYGRGPTRAKTYLLDERYVVCVLGETMTTVERTLVELGQGELARRVRVKFQEAMVDEYKQVVERALGRRVIAYHSQLSVEQDIGFEFFVLED